MPVTLLVSASEEETARLTEGGPRRDFLELARKTAGRTVFARERRRGGIRGRLLGPHVRQAWRAAGDAKEGDTVFADGEHNGIPFLLYLQLRRQRVKRVVMLGHLVGRPWKRALLCLVTRLGTPGALLVHSEAQADLVRPWIGRRWAVALVPYQVDSDFWQTKAEPQQPPLVVAVGSESRDYRVLIEAVRGLDLKLTIAAGSHWARSAAKAESLPLNVTLLTEPLPFAQLRALYDRAQAIVVPLQDVPNQSGVTTILEAMSMSRPVVVTATRGQREVLRGPLVCADGSFQRAATQDRGPHRFGGETSDAHGDTGLYVPVGDAAALRAAIERLAGDRDLAARLGGAGRRAAVAHFTLEAFTERLALALAAGGSAAAVSERSVA